MNKNVWKIIWKASKEAHRDFWAPLAAFWKELTNFGLQKNGENHRL